MRWLRNQLQCLECLWALRLMLLGQHPPRPRGLPTYLAACSWRLAHLAPPIHQRPIAIMDAAIAHVRARAENARKNSRLSAIVLMLYICAAVSNFNDSNAPVPASFGADYAWGHAQLAGRPDQAFPVFAAAAAQPNAPDFNELLSTTGILNVGVVDKYVVFKHKYMVSARLAHWNAAEGCSGRHRSLRARAISDAAAPPIPRRRLFPPLAVAGTVPEPPLVHRHRHCAQPGRHLLLFPRGEGV